MRPAPPHFATCSTYKQHRMMCLDDADQVAIGALVGSASRNVKSLGFARNRSQTMGTREPPGSPAARPEVLGIVRSWYNDQQHQQHQQFGTIDSPSSSIGGGICDRSSYPSSSSSSYPNRERSLVIGRPNMSFYSMVASRERDSSLESNEPPPSSSSCGQRYPRKAYMDLHDAIALLDETCPNPASPPSLTPRTPRTPLTPFPRGKRARSKSSDNSSNYSNELAPVAGSTEATRSQEKPHSDAVKQRRPFLRRIGGSKTEDRPFLAKTTPRIIGKPYLEKIGPSRAVEKPFLEKIGSSKTLDRFTFEALRELPRAMARRCQPSPLSIERTQRREETPEDEEDVVLCIIKNEMDDPPDEDDGSEDRARGRSNGKGYLLKMYSFEAEESNAPSQVAKTRADLGLLEVIDTGPSSLPPTEDSHEAGRSDDRSSSVAELVKCRVTTSEIFTTVSGHRASSPREATSWGNSPSDWSRRRSRRVASTPRSSRAEGDHSTRVFPSDESTPDSPSKRPMSHDREENETETVLSRTRGIRTSRKAVGSPLKTRRLANEEAASSDSKSTGPFSVETGLKDDHIDFARCKSRRQTFRAAMEKFGGGEYSKTRRQVSVEVPDKEGENGESPIYEDANSRFERRGISSDNLKLSRETVVVSVPSTSSLGYQSGDSSLVSQRSSCHSQQDFIRGTLKILHDKFELQEVPSESYAAFKRRTKAHHLHSHHRYHHHKERHRHRDNEGSNEIDGPRSVDPTTDENRRNNESPTTNLATASDDAADTRGTTRSASEEISTDSKTSITARSVLRKQEGVDQSDQEAEGSSIRGPKRRMTNEPSQETMDLLTELRRVKSMLKTPSIEADSDHNNPPTRCPKKILLTDREFCLSVERENSVRRRPSTLPAEESTKSAPISDDRRDERAVPSEPRSSRRQRTVNRNGPALFEKRCLSLDYADDEKPPKPEARAISLVASSRTPRSGTVDYETLGSSDLVGLDYDARSYSSDVFTSPSDENEEPRPTTATATIVGSSEPSPNEEFPDFDNRSADVDIAIPVDHGGSPSPKRRVHPQGRTSDLYEIMSPRSTPFRVKKRLGRVSIEDRVKPENFTLSKVGSGAVAIQKRTKCFPL